MNVQLCTDYHQYNTKKKIKTNNSNLATTYKVKKRYEK